MTRALALAKNGKGQVSPNPMVGCVVTYKGRILGEGWHQQYGGPHAEVNALQAVEETSLLPHSTVYVTLEPCSHHGKTPPCADLLIKKKVKRVVVATTDPNPKVSGRGIERLKQAGIEVTTGVLTAEAQEINRRFFTAQVAKRPYILLKWAETADGFIARSDGDSKWISNELARQWVHKTRTEEDGILVGSGTALADNPMLTARDWPGTNPTRIVLDRSARLAANLNLFDGSVPTRWYTCTASQGIGAAEHVRVDRERFLENVLQDLFQQGIHSILVEGGTQTINAFLTEGLWEEAYQFISETTFGEGISAPKLNGTHSQTLALADNTVIHTINTNQVWQRN